jgi:hypothetical protein
MATDAILSLNRLLCIRESDESGNSEPYIWPVLMWIDDNTLATPEQIGVTTPALGNARVVIKSDMRAGQTADIPASVGVLRVRLEDGLTIRRLILAVALWEEDETPDAALRAGFQAFSSELRAAIADNLFALNQASEEEQEAIIETIKVRVRDRVGSSIENGLTGLQKVRVLLGLLNLDDFIDSDFKNFPDLLPAPITLTFGVNPAGRLLFYRDTTQNGTGDVANPSIIGLGGWDAFKFLFSGGDGIIYAVDQDGQLLFYRDTTQNGTGDVANPSIIGLGGWDAFKFLFSGGNGIIYAVDQADRSSNEYEIHGELRAQPVHIDLCQAEVDRVKAAQTAVDAIDAQISALQSELGHASPGKKPFILSEIRRLRKEELPVAMAALEDARQALRACSERRPPILDLESELAPIEPTTHGPVGEGK